MNSQCALCAKATATIYCVNDDASLCSSCDVKYHANPLAARHERRPLPALNEDGGSVAGCPSESFDDVAVVPQFDSAAPAAVPQQQNVGAMNTANIFDDMFAFSPSFVEPTEDDYLNGPGFPSVDEIAADMLDFDCVVPSLSEDELADSLVLESSPFFPSMMPIKAMKVEDPAPNAMVMVPQLPASEATFDDAMLMDDEEDYEEDVSDDEYRVVTRRPSARPRREAAASAAVTDAPLLTREQRVQRYKEKRARRNFRKTIRYQSRKAYAEIRPRVKGRFVSPEEYAAYMAQREVTEAVVPAC